MTRIGGAPTAFPVGYGSSLPGHSPVRAAEQPDRGRRAEQRILRAPLRLQLPHLGNGRLAGEVGTVHGEVRVEQVRVVAARVALHILVGQRHDQARVVLAELGDGLTEDGPEMLAVHRADDPVVDPAVGDLATVGVRQRRLAGRGDRTDDGGTWVLPDRALAGVRLAPGDEVPERQLEAAGLGFRPRHGALQRIDRAVEHHRTDLRREQLGVDGAEERPVRVAEVAEFRVTDRATDRVHVAGSLLGREQRQLRAVLRAASRLGLFRVGDDRVELRGRDRIGRLGIEFVLVFRADALHLGRVTDTAGVETDEIETVGDRVRQLLRQLDGKFDARGARAARIHEQRPDAVALIVVTHPDEREVERLSVVRVLPVLRHLDRAAIEGITTHRLVEDLARYVAAAVSS